MISPLALISEESLEIAINAWDALFFGVAKMRLEFRIKDVLYFVLYCIFRTNFYKLHIPFVVYSEYKAGNTVSQMKMAVRTVFNTQLSTSCTIPNMETGHAALALHRTGNPSWKI